jgi:hypothetical protein
MIKRVGEMALTVREAHVIRAEARWWRPDSWGHADVGG